LITAETVFLYDFLTNEGVFSLPVLFVILVISLAVMMAGAHWLVEGAASLAYRAGVSKIIVGATVVSLGSTAPEAAVSVLAAVRGQGGLALGNALGSVIIDTGLIFGICALVTRIPADKYILNRQGWVQLAAGVLLAAIAMFTFLSQGISTIGRPVGVFLLVLLVLYICASIHWSKQSPEIYEEKAQAVPLLSKTYMCVICIIAGLALVIVGAQFLIGSATQISVVFEVPQSVISATIIALGTSLPELSIGITSIRKGHPEIMLGNIIGADILNILFVVGASAATTPLAVPWEVAWIHFPAMLLILIIFRVCIFTAKESFSRWCGLPLLAVYIAFNIIAYTVRSPAG